MSRVRGALNPATSNLQVALNDIVQDIDDKIPSKYGYRKVDIANVADISSSTPQMTSDPKKRRGFKYTNTGGPTEQVDIIMYDSANEAGLFLRQLDSIWMLMSVDNANSNQAPYFQVTTSASVIQYKLDFPNTHLGEGERCLFYSGLLPQIGDSDARKVRLSQRVLVSGPADSGESITSIKVVSDSAALANEVDCLFESLGFESNKNANINQDVVRTFDLVGWDTYTPIVDAITGLGSTVPVVGSHNNSAPPATLTGSSTWDDATSVDCQYVSKLTAFGSVTPDTQITVKLQQSQNNTNWYDTGVSWVSVGTSTQDFFMSLPDAGTRYYRLSYQETNATPSVSNGVGSIAGKN